MNELERKKLKSRNNVKVEFIVRCRRSYILIKEKGVMYITSYFRI